VIRRKPNSLNSAQFSQTSIEVMTPGFGAIPIVKTEAFALQSSH